MTPKQSLKEVLIKGKTKQVLAELYKITNGNTDLQNQVIQLSARFADYEKKQLGNLENPAVLGIELAKINQTALAIIEDLSPSDTTPETGKTPTKPGFSWTNWTGLNDVKSWIAVIAGIAAILTFYFKYCEGESHEGQLKNVTVMVEDKNGEFVMRQQGKIVMMVEGGDVKQEDIDSKGAASFRNVKIGDKVRLKVDFSEPYRPLNPDSLYTIPGDGRINLRVGLQNLDKVFGRVLYRDKELAGVIVSVGSLRDTTDDLGLYEILIPENDQRKEQDVFFKANGLKSMTKKAFPQTNQPLNVVMEK